MTEQIDYDPNTVLEVLNNKADRDLNNVTDGTYQVLTTKNVTNCITKIPQDIKLELNNGTLTLKAGSKVYDGNGLYYQLSSDMTYTYNYDRNGSMLLIYKYSNGNYYFGVALGSETVDSIPTQQETPDYIVKYCTANKKCYYQDKRGLNETSFPIAIFTSTVESSFTSIDQIFNGFSYIGDTIFALPGVEGLIPNGRNADGSLNNTKFTTSSVLTVTSPDKRSAYITLNETDVAIPTLSEFVYDQFSNKNLFVGSPSKYCIVGTCDSDSTGHITSFTPKTTLQILDRNDKEEIISWGIPDYSAALSGRDFNSEGNPITAPRFFYIQSATNMIFKVNDVQYTVPFWVYVSPDDVRTASTTAGGASYQCIECPLKGVI